LEFSFIFALYEGGSGQPAKAADSEAYAETVGAKKFPVFADGKEKFADATPIDFTTHPYLCAISPEMVILECFSGHGTTDAALDAVRADAGI
jgi:hypothetical protein